MKVFGNWDLAHAETAKLASNRLDNMTARQLTHRTKGARYLLKKQLTALLLVSSNQNGMEYELRLPKYLSREY